MASIAYTSIFKKLSDGTIDIDGVTVKVMLVTSAYTESKNHNFRSDVTNEVTGTGYTAGGTTVSGVTLTLDTTNNRVDIAFPQVTWASSTITARKAIYYVSRGGASSADELIGCDDFGSDVTTSAGTFTLSASTLRHQN